MFGAFNDVHVRSFMHNAANPAMTPVSDGGGKKAPPSFRPYHRRHACFLVEL